MAGWKAATITTITVGAILYGIYRLQSLLIYPSNYPEGSRTHVNLPSEYNLPYEDIRLDTPDGVSLQVYLILQQEKVSRKTVIMLGPNAGNIGMALPLAERFYRLMGTNVVMLSYRGYGLSTGSASEKGIKIDADTLMAWISDHSDLRDTKLILYGRSLGGAVATYIASKKYPALSAFIVENTFLSISKLIPSVFPIAIPFSYLLTERWESEKLITKIDPTLPALFLAGGKDELIPPSHFRQLFDLCASTAKTMKTYPEGTHNDTLVQPGYWKDLTNFVSRIF